MSEDYAVVSLLSLNSRPCVRPATIRIDSPPYRNIVEAPTVRHSEGCDRYIFGSSEIGPLSEAIDDFRQADFSLRIAVS